ncbi:MAG: hypothetical protein J3R72DRAFT_464231 [Linnemannia gamsii]|nr:MAG: hypothetical protein J3R72DRAFT_464231 [Linnemannia gamsii]
MECPFVASQKLFLCCLSVLSWITNNNSRRIETLNRGKRKNKKNESCQYWTYVHVCASLCICRIIDQSTLVPMHFSLS